MDCAGLLGGEMYFCFWDRSFSYWTQYQPIVAQVYEALFCMSTRDFKKAADLFLDATTTFATYDLQSSSALIYSLLHLYINNSHFLVSDSNRIYYCIGSFVVVVAH